MLLTGIDFETTFTDPIDITKARVIEIGVIVWDTDRKFPVRLVNVVLYSPEYDALFDSRITDKTGLTLPDLKKYGMKPKAGFEMLAKFIGDAEYCVAHNGNIFDKPLAIEECKRHGVELPERQWLDTRTDVPYPEKIKTRALDFLGPSHGFLNPFAHRAVFDVLSMFKVLANYDIAQVIHRAAAQKVTLRATTQKPWHDGGRSNALAKDRGFHFDGDNTKMWIKTVLADEVAAELAAPGLEVVVLK